MTKREASNVRAPGWQRVVVSLLSGTAIAAAAGWFFPGYLAAAVSSATVECAHCVDTAGATLATASAPIGGPLRFFDNYGNYMPRIHCLRDTSGNPDWPWIAALVVLNAGVIVGYTKIFGFWRRSYLAEAPRDRNRKLMDLAYIFLWCAICGYAMSIVMFVWPAYRLLAIFLAVLNFFTWRFAQNLGELNVSLSAVRIRRELEETLANRAAELARQVEERTRELEAARAAAIAADEAKSHFLANMSHEIRTPMTAILGFTELLDGPNIDPATRQRHLKTVRESGRHLLNVVNDILDLAKIEAGKFNIERLPCDFRELLEDVRALNAQRAAEKGLTLTLDVDEGVPHRVVTDPTRVRQVLLNLVGNAIKFTEQGAVALRARCERVDGVQSHVVIDVLDTGMGMTPEQLERLFQRFNQAEASTARRFGGSGLGLVIARHLVNLLEGELSVESEHGRGSRFSVHLPLVCDLRPADSIDGDGLSAHINGYGMPLPATPAPRGHDPLRASRLQELTVLLVDDGVENRTLVQFLLEREGITVDIAEDGQVALDRVAASPARYDAILMDMHMPVVDGYIATSTLRQRGYRGTIIALTASTMSGDAERSIAAGCDHHIGKPIDADLLLDTLAQASPQPLTP